MDLNATIRPHLSIVDGVTAMEGTAPIMGKARHLGFIGVGTDLAAVDATCARIIGLDPTRLPYLKAAGDFSATSTSPKSSSAARLLHGMRRRSKYPPGFRRAV